MIARRRVLIGASVLAVGTGVGLWALHPKVVLILRRRRFLEALSKGLWRYPVRHLEDGFVMVDGWILKSGDLAPTP